ncbi:hypothetical protein ABZ769_22645 [Streptomyces olivoreticuli]
MAGLFREPMPPTREVLTLAGCAQAGALAAGATRLGELCLTVSNEVRPLQRWGLTDVVVLTRRPHALDPTLVDVVLEVVVSEPDSGRHGLADSPQFDLVGGWPESVSYGTCLSVNGLYEERPEPPEIPITLVGCRPGAPMLSTLTEGEDEYLMLGVLDRKGRSMAGPLVLLARPADAPLRARRRARRHRPQLLQQPVLAQVTWEEPLPVDGPQRGPSTCPQALPLPPRRRRGSNRSGVL